MMKYFFGRRNYLVAPRFQLVLAAKATVFLILYSAGVAFLILYPLRELIELLPVTGLTPDVKKQMLALPSYVWPLLLVLAVVGGIQVIFWSHRVAGPSFRLTRAIRQMTGGDYRQALTLRKKDSLKEVAESLAVLCETLRWRRQTLLEELHTLRTRLEQHAECMQGGDSRPREREIEEMLQQIEVLERLAMGNDLPATAAPVGFGPHSSSASILEDSTPSVCG